MRPILASLVMAALWCSGSPCLAQYAPLLDTLEQIKAKAVANNPDLLLAEAKIRVAETRLQVTKAELLQTRNRPGEKIVAEAEFLVADSQVQRAKAELGRSRLELLEQIVAAYSDAEAAWDEAEMARKRYVRAREINNRCRGFGAEEFRSFELMYFNSQIDRIVALARLEALVGAPVVVDAAPK